MEITSIDLASQSDTDDALDEADETALSCAIYISG